MLQLFTKPNFSLLILAILFFSTNTLTAQKASDVVFSVSSTSEKQPFSDAVPPEGFYSDNAKKAATGNTANTFAVPANDLCENAQLLLGDTVLENVDISDATQNDSPDNSTSGRPPVCTPGSSNIGNGVWYKFTGSGGTLDFIVDDSNSTVDLEIALYTGTCGDLTCVGGSDNPESVLDYLTEAGTEYYIYIGSWAIFAPPSGTFNFSLTGGVSDGTVCEPFEFDIESASLDTEKGVDGTNVYVVEVCGGDPSYSLEFETSPANIFATVDQYPGNSIDCRKLRVTYGDGAEWVVRVIDTNDCTGEISYLDVRNEEMTIMEFASTNESKAGLSDGTARVEVEGGNDPYGVYTYEWTGPLTSITVTDGSDGNEQTGLPAGIYTVVVTDAANNSQTISGVVKRNSWGGRGRGRAGKTALELGSGELFLAATPNPFEDFTTIQFQTSTVENISIEVFGMNGQQVAHLFEGQSTGDSLQSVTFDRGSLQAGTYIVRLVSESGVVQHQKVVVY